MKRAAPAILLYAFTLTRSLSSLAADNPVDNIEELTRQWTSLEHQKDTLRANWRNDKPVLEQQLSLLSREREQLTEMLQETEQQQDEVEEKRRTLLEEQTRLEQEQALVTRELDIALIDIQGLHPQLPPPLKESWDALLPRLLNTQLTSSERLQVLIEMLTDLDDFNRKVTLHQSVMTMADGEEYLMSQVYLGLSTGWYVSNDGQFAGVGRATTEGWQWDTASETADISAMVAILERRRNAELVSVPVMSGGVQ